MTDKQILSSDAIITEIKALLDWYAQIWRHCFYPESRKQPAEVQPPSSLLVWFQQQAEKNNLDAKNVDHLMGVYEGLHESARNCLSTSAPTLEQYDFLTHHLEAYIMYLHRLQQHLTDIVSSAVDPVTGLRTIFGIHEDLKREQERFNRKGTPFSIANLQIDGLPDLESRFDRAGMEVLYMHIAKIIIKTIRSFDDAYHPGKGEFILVLKHVEFLDACAVMDRMRHNIAVTPVILKNGEEVQLTASFGLAEALKGSASDLIIAHAKEALQKAKLTGGNRVCEYREQSAFNTFVKNTDKDRE